MHWFLLASNFLFDLKDTLITKWSFVMSWAIETVLLAWNVTGHLVASNIFVSGVYTHTLKVKIIFLNWVCNPFHPIPYLSWTWHVYAFLDSSNSTSVDGLVIGSWFSPGHRAMAGYAHWIGCSLLGIFASWLLLADHWLFHVVTSENGRVTMSC